MGIGGNAGAAGPTGGEGGQGGGGGGGGQGGGGSFGLYIHGLSNADMGKMRIDNTSLKAKTGGTGGAGAAEFGPPGVSSALLRLARPPP